MQRENPMLFSARQDQEMMEFQMQKQMEEQLEASKQMVYEVFQNTLGILEEFEKRELLEHGIDLPIQRSIVQIPNQSKKRNADVQAILQTQILLLETQMKTCFTSVRDAASAELRNATLKWVAVRQQRQIPMSHTDQFAGQIFQVVSKKETIHPPAFYQSPGTVPNVSFENMEQVLTQQFRVPAIKGEFLDGKKKAIAPDTRTEDINLGIERLKQDPRLFSILPNPDRSRWGEITDKNLEDSVDRISLHDTNISSKKNGVPYNDMRLNVGKNYQSGENKCLPQQKYDESLQEGFKHHLPPKKNESCDNGEQNNIKRNNFSEANDGFPHDVGPVVTQYNEDMNSYKNATEVRKTTEHKDGDVHEGDEMTVSSEDQSHVEQL